MKKIICILVSMALFVSLTGCGTIMGKSAPEALNITSIPDGASVSVSDESGRVVFKGKTPTTVSLNKKKSYFRGKKYSVHIHKEGYMDRRVSVGTTISGLVLWQYHIWRLDRVVDSGPADWWYVDFGYKRDRHNVRVRKQRIIECGWPQAEYRSVKRCANIALQGYGRSKINSYCRRLRFNTRFVEGTGYTFDDEYGPCDYCKSLITQINGHNDDVSVDFNDPKLFDPGKVFYMAV